MSQNDAVLGVVHVLTVFAQRDVVPAGALHVLRTGSGWGLPVKGRLDPSVGGSGYYSGRSPD